MNLLVQIPSIVEKYSSYFQDLFSQDGFEYFKRFISGLIVSENKTIEGINRLFVLEPRHQASANKFMNRQNFDIEALNTRRVSFMQEHPSTSFKPIPATKGGGVLSIDNSLLSHYGEHFDGIYRLWDYVNKRYTMAHDLVTLYYSDNQTDYPVDYKLWEAPDWDAVAIHFKSIGVHINEQKWEKRTEEPKKWREYMRYRYRDYNYKKPSVQEIYKSKNHIAIDLLRKFKSQYPDYDFPVALDSGFTSPMNCEIINTELNMTYVGFLKDTQQVILAGSVQKSLTDFVTQLKEEHQKTGKVFQKTTIFYKGEKKTFYAYCKNHNLKNYKCKQRLVISFQKDDLSDTPRYTICNQLSWYASGILTIRSHRWPVETYHQEGKNEGLQSYQARNIEAIQSHIAFVVVAYSMLRRAQHDNDLLSSIQQLLHIEVNGTLAFLRRLMKAEAVAHFVKYILNVNTFEDRLLKILRPFFAQTAYH